MTITDEMVGLLACPCCGSAAEFIDCDETDNVGGRAVQCGNRSCMLSSRVIFGEDIDRQLAECWNNRSATTTDEKVERDSIFTKRPISHDEATEVANRLINSHFRQEPHARASIPAKPDYDDDLLILAYIHQRRASSALPAAPHMTILRADDIKRMDDLLAHIDSINDERDSVPILLVVRELWPSIRATISTAPHVPEGWRCFTCGELFTDREKAEGHFGRFKDDVALCRMSHFDLYALRRDRDSWEQKARDADRDADHLKAENLRLISQIEMMTKAVAPHVPEGWQLVPKIASKDMLSAFDKYNEEHIVGEWAFEDCYRDVIAAVAPASSPPVAALHVPEGFQLVPKKLTEEMIDAGCECDAYSIAVHENKKRHEDLMAKYPDQIKPKETHGAAPVQTLPIVWAAMLAAAPPPPPAAGREAALEEAITEILNTRLDEWEFSAGKVISKIHVIARSALASKPTPAGEDGE